MFTPSANTPFVVKPIITLSYETRKYNFRPQPNTTGPFDSVQAACAFYREHLLTDKTIEITTAKILQDGHVAQVIR